MMWNWGYGSWWMGLSMFVFWAGMVGLIVWAVRTGRPGEAGADRRRASEILEERYAKGEIDDDEFDRRRAALERR